MDGFLFLQALFLGVLQGLTEFLPISSSAHLILIPWFFRWNNPLVNSLTFDLALHAGTLLAILWYYWKDWVGLAQGFLKMILRGKVEEFPQRLILYIIFSTIPAAIAGFYLQKMIEESFRNPGRIVFPLTLVSFLMIYAEKRFRSHHPLEKIDFKDSLMIGFAQALALFPGVSRSGITITTGLLRGYEREAAMRFSFLLSTPILAGAVLFQFRHFSSAGPGSEWLIFAIGLASSGFVGYLSIAFLMRYLKNHTLNVFAGYRLLLAVAVLIGYLGKGLT